MKATKTTWGCLHNNKDTFSLALLVSTQYTDEQETAIKPINDVLKAVDGIEKKMEGIREEVEGIEKVPYPPLLSLSLSLDRKSVV